MICGMGSKTGLLAKKGGAADVTPDAVDWPNITDVGPSVTTATRTITGINTTITLQLDRTSTSGPVAYSLNGGSFVNFTSGTTISVSNNDTLAFRSTRVLSVQRVTITVKNNSDNSKILDTVFILSDSSAGGP